MYLSEELLEKIGDSFKLNNAEKEIFNEVIRSYQGMIFWNALLLYYEKNKTDLEKKYLSQLIKNLEKNPQNLEKIGKLIGKEAEYNPEIISFINNKMTNYIIEIISTFNHNKDKQEIRNVLKELFPFYKVLDKAKQQNLL